jgi:cytochrome c biogenesis protein CcmG/thiol:disulfide interchange protein DsbE
MSFQLKLRKLAWLFVTTIALASASIAWGDEVVDLSEYEGKVVILDFWASWCVPCRRSFPWLDHMQDKYAGDGLIIIGVNLDNESAAAQAFLDEFQPGFEIFFDKDKELAREFDVVAMPSSYIIGRDGNLFKRHLGFKVKLEADYEAAIIDALSAKEMTDE